MTVLLFARSSYGTYLRLFDRKGRRVSKPASLLRTRGKHVHKPPKMFRLAVLALASTSLAACSSGSDDPLDDDALGDVVSIPAAVGDDDVVTPAVVPAEPTAPIVVPTTPTVVPAAPADDPAAPVTPEAPAAPVTPEAPAAPVTPEAPAAPVTPEAPAAPVTPEAPTAPVTPEAPTAPVTPEAPAAPVTPTEPAEPVTPEAPAAPQEEEEEASTPPALLPGEVPPTLPNPFADAVPGPSADDFFNTGLDEDNEQAVAGGPPTTPKNLRIDLVSNDWAEINWAPSNDDDGVAAYRIYRSDGVVYDLERDLAVNNAGIQSELDKYWATTSFIDCNFTRFFDLVYDCAVNGPNPGETYTYEVSAIDEDGQESPRSNPVTITYHAERGAPVPRYEDPYLNTDDDFAQRNDLSETRFFLDEFATTFEDEFDGTSLDDSKWTTGLVWGDTRIINGEQQYFVNTQEQPGFGYDPFSFTGDSLIIEAVPIPDELRSNLPPICDEPDPTGLDRCEFLSGALSTHNTDGTSKYQFLYGYTEARIKVSDSAGALSSFYLFHRYPGVGLDRQAPEIDILEYLGENPFGDEDAFQTYHFDDVATGITRSSPTMSFANPTGELFSEEFHTFGVLWEPSLIIWYVDGIEIARLTGPQVGRQPMNIINYLVAGSAWAPTPDASDPDVFPMELEVDYIRVMQREAYFGAGS